MLMTDAFGLIMSAKSKQNEIRNVVKSVKNELNKNEDKTFKKIVEHKKRFYQNKTMASMRSFRKGGKFWSFLDKLGKIQGISVNTWKDPYKRQKCFVDAPFTCKKQIDFVVKKLK